MFSFTRSRLGRVLATSAGGALVAGALMTGTAAAESTAPDPAQAMAEACPAGHLCVWGEPLGQGVQHNFYTCGEVDVRDFGLDRVGSFVNNQTDGTVATFRGPPEQGQPWFEQYTSTAFEIRDNDQGFLTYGIRVC